MRSPIWNQFNRPDISSILEHLSISRNSLKTLPAETLSLVNLLRLDISHCDMHSMGDISVLDKLEEIDMSYNDFEDDSIEALPPNLFNVNANYNHFINIPKVFFRESFISSLKYLDLSNNRLKNLDGIGKLTSLIEFRANNNHIKIIPEEIKNLVNLKKIELKNNYITCYALVEEILDENSKKLTIKVVDNSEEYESLPTNSTIIPPFSPLPSSMKTPSIYPESNNKLSLNLLNSPTSIADPSIFSPTPSSMSKNLFNDINTPFSPSKKIIQSIPHELFLLPELESVELGGNPIKHRELLEINSVEKFMNKKISLKQKLLGLDKKNYKIFGLA